MQSFRKAQKHSSINLHEGNIAALKEIEPITTIYKEVANLLFEITLQMSVGKHFFWRMEMQCYIKKSEVNNFQPMLYHWIVFSFWSNFLIVFCLYQLLTEKWVFHCFAQIPISYSTEPIQTFEYKHVLLHEVTDPTSEIPFQGSTKLKAGLWGETHTHPTPFALKTFEETHRATPLTPFADTKALAVCRETEHPLSFH